MKGALMVVGTGSDAGKSVVVAGICRWLLRQGVEVAPFKAQNMALNSYVTRGGGEIGRAQAAQAAAAGVEPEVMMNPILLKPTGPASSQVVVMGRPVADLDATGYQHSKSKFLPTVLEALDSLRERYEVVVLEGAGSPAEINLPGDLVNLGLAAFREIPAIVVGDIERGGVFASLYGTVALLDPERRRLVKAFVVNKLRGDPDLLIGGPEEIAKRCGIAHVGTLPFVEGLGIDGEDSMELARWSGSTLPPDDGALGDRIDVAVIRVPYISNFTDFDPLAAEPAVEVRLVNQARALGTPDVIVLPGTKSTVGDLAWMERSGMDEAVRAAHRSGTVLLGICGGYQMLGTSICDEVESRAGKVKALGLLDVETSFEKEKLTRRRSGRASRWCTGGPVLSGYEIHHGRTRVGPGCSSFAELDGDEEGAVSTNRRTFGTNLHGLFEEDEFRNAFFFTVANLREKRFSPSGVSFRSLREAQLDLLGDLVTEHLDTRALTRIIEGIA